MMNQPIVVRHQLIGLQNAPTDATHSRELLAALGDKRRDRTLRVVAGAKEFCICFAYAAGSAVITVALLAWISQ